MKDGFIIAERKRRQRPGGVITLSGLRQRLAFLERTHPERVNERAALSAWIDEMLAGRPNV